MQYPVRDKQQQQQQQQQQWDWGEGARARVRCSNRSVNDMHSTGFVGFFFLPPFPPLSSLDGSRDELYPPIVFSASLHAVSLSLSLFLYKKERRRWSTFCFLLKKPKGASKTPESTTAARVCVCYELRKTF